jgi:carboxyl-terminal processing protease
MKVTSTAKALGVLLLLCFGIWWGGHPAQLPGFLRTVFVANSGDTIVSEALSDIQHDYFRPVGRSGLVNGSIAGAVASLDDPYAVYDTPSVFHAFNNPPPQRISGVGIDIEPSAAGLVVQNVLAGQPAARAGVRSGDVITAVDGHSVAGASSTTATNLIRGRAGTDVILAVTRGTRHLTFTIKRAVINTPIVLASVDNYHGVKIGVIELPTFDVIGIHDDVGAALESLKARHVRAIVLDLRNNPGGLVEEAQLVVSMFVAHGKVVTTRGRTQPTTTLYVTGHPIAPTLPLAVLVNGDTASAAEITTGALQDNHRAVVVGTHTYGKGVFQEIRPISNGGALDITVGEYYLPDGQNLGAGGLRRGHGITPNVIVNAAPSGLSDPQLQAALRLLAAKVH